MPRVLIKHISVKRLRPGQTPEDEIVDVFGILAPEGANIDAMWCVATCLYIVQSIDQEVRLERMEEMELDYGLESVFYDRTGNCYVRSEFFDCNARLLAGLSGHGFSPSARISPSHASVAGLKASPL